MNEHEFECQIRTIVPNPSVKATKAWLTYANDLEQAGTCDAAWFRSSTCSELRTVRDKFGKDIAEHLYNGGENFTLNPFELQGAANLLKDGSSWQEVIEKVLEGSCTADQPVPQRPKRATHER